MSLNQSVNWCENRKQIVSAKSASLEFVPEITSDLKIYTEDLRHIQEELDWYRTLYDYNPGIYFQMDTNGIILSVNQFGAKSLGYAPRDLSQKLIFDLFASFECERDYLMY